LTGNIANTITGARERLFERAARRYFAVFCTGHRLKLASLILSATLLSLPVLPTLILVRRAFDLAVPSGNVQLLPGCVPAILLIGHDPMVISVTDRVRYSKDSILIGQQRESMQAS
jgi:hypothetical protein